MEIVDRIKRLGLENPKSFTTFGRHPANVISIAPLLENASHQIGSIVRPNEPSEKIHMAYSIFQMRYYFSQVKVMIPPYL